MPAVSDTEVGASASVQSVDRALTILEMLAREGEAGVTEIAAELGVHKSTAFRLLATLESHRLVEQDGDRGRYRLGVGNLRLAGATTATARPGHRGAAGLPAARGRHRRDRQHHGPQRDQRPLPRPGRGQQRAAEPQLGRAAHPAARDQQRQGAAERAVRGRPARRRSGSCPRFTDKTVTSGRSSRTSWSRSARPGTPWRWTSSRSGSPRPRRRSATPTATSSPR